MSQFYRLTTDNLAVIADNVEDAAIKFADAISGASNDHIGDFTIVEGTVTAKRAPRKSKKEVKAEAEAEAEAAA